MKSMVSYSLPIIAVLCSVVEIHISGLALCFRACGNFDGEGRLGPCVDKLDPSMQ